MDGRSSHAEKKSLNGKKLLEGEAYIVAIAKNGREALDYLRGNAPPDLVLLNLTVMDGYEFRRAQRSDPVLASIPVIVLYAVWEGPSSLSSTEERGHPPISPCSARWPTSLSWKARAGKG